MTGAVCHVREQYPTSTPEYGMRRHQLSCSIIIFSLWLNDPLCCPRCWSTLIYAMTYGMTCTNPLFELLPLCAIRTQVPLILVAKVGTRSDYLSQHKTSPSLARDNTCTRMHHNAKCVATLSMCPPGNGRELKISIFHKTVSINIVKLNHNIIKYMFLAYSTSALGPSRFCAQTYNYGLKTLQRRNLIFI